MADRAAWEAVERALTRASGATDPLARAAAAWLADLSPAPAPAAVEPQRMTGGTPRADAALRRRAAAGLAAVRAGVDPALALSYVVWPSMRVLDAEAEREAQLADAALGDWDELLGVAAA